MVMLAAKAMTLMTMKMVLWRNMKVWVELVRMTVEVKRGMVRACDDADDDCE